MSQTPSKPVRAATAPKRHSFELLREEAYIDGAWVAGETQMSVYDKATGEEIARVADLGAAETTRAIEAAHRALPAWGQLVAKERARLLRKWYDLIIENVDALAAILTAEQGKPLAEAKGEILYGSGFVEFFAEEAKRVYGETMPSPKADARILTIRQPVGVVAAITPWNFPNAMITRKISPALAAGCTVVVKPAEETPLSALALAELAHRAGFPPGVLNVVTTSRPAEVGAAMTGNSHVRMVTFTGSTEVGKILMRACAASVKHVGMELGGNAPFIVFDDADLDRAIAGIMTSKFRNAGQTCVCANRIFVQDAVYDAFAARLEAAVADLKLGAGTEPGVTLGPLINGGAVEKVEAHVADALAGGAKLRVGGKRHALGGSFYEPTILTGVTPKMRLFREETFGPVAPLIRFKTEAEAIAMANDTTSGLAAYFYTRDLGRVVRMYEALEYGMVGVNEGMLSTELAPFGGIKESGVGREGSHHGMTEFLEIKYVMLGGV